MTAESFAHFMLRRLLRTTLFFFALLSVVLATTSVYYVVRISMIEKHTYAQEAAPASPAAKELDATFNAADGSSGHRLTSHPTEHGRAQQMVRSKPGHLKLAPRDGFPFRYKELVVGTPLSRQAVRNPTLPETIPVYEEVEEHTADVEEGQRRTHSVVVQPRQRYVLSGLEAGKHYMLRLSFLGSPSVSFELLLYQVRRSHVQRSEATSGEVRGWATVPQDTELRVFATSHTNALEFDYEESVWVEGVEDEVGGHPGDAEAPFSASAARQAMIDAADSSDFFVPVVEVRPRALSIPVDSSRIPVVHFNIEVEPLSSSFLPQVMVPLVTYGAWVWMFVGYLGIYTLVSSGIAGGRAHTD